jgi:excisionase family DNA binding protein
VVIDHRFLTYAQAAEYTTLKLGTLRSMVCHKTIPHVRIGPRSVTFDRAELDLWLESRKVAA